MIPNEYEKKVLEMMAGKRDWEYGSWVNACCEFLQEGGFCTRMGQLTEKGRKWLETQEF